MSATETCPQCGKPLDADSPQGLCPACLLRQAMNSQATLPVDSRAGESGAAFTPPPPADLAQYFPQLEILELIGRGGMGAVYRARQRALDRIVALKVLPPAVSRDPSFEERFTREARALARVNHPNIVNVYEFGQSPAGLFYFVMEYVDGVNLRQMIRAQQLKPREALAIIPQICDALQYAHDEGIVHRDIKPENILIDRKGRVKIADFGLAKILNPRAADYTLTSPQMVMGTPHYMAPEQLEKPATVDHRADIYSLGVVFYEMLTGELPLGRFAPPSHKITLDIRLDEVVLKTLEKEPRLRYQQASQVRTEVETIARHVPAAQAGPVARRDAGAARGRAPAAMLPRTALWIVGLLSLVAFLSYNESHDGAQTRTTVGLFDPWFVSVTGQYTRIDLFSGSTLFALASLACAWLLARGGRKAAPAGSSTTSASYTLHPDRRLSRTALVGAILAPLPLLVMPAYLVPVASRTAVVQESVQATPHRTGTVTRPEPIRQRAARADAGGDSSPAPRMVIALLVTLAMGLAAPFVTTILGLVAIGQIRASQGRLYGLPLAVADAVLYPLIVLDLLIGAFWYNVLPDAAAMNWPAVVILTVISCVIADVLIVRNCLRRARSSENRGA